MSDQTRRPGSSPTRRRIAGERSRRTPSPARPGTPEEPTTPQEAFGPEVPADPALPVGWVPSWLLVGLAVLLLAAVAFDAIVLVRSHNQDTQRTTQSAAITSAFNQAPAQAETAATHILGYDYATLRKDADKAKTFMTPTYAATFQKTVDGLLQKPADQVKAHVEAQVKASGVVSATASTVNVMLFIDQTSTTTAHAQPQTYLNRVVFTMARSDGRWLVDDVTAL